jgi:hypothetical protein
MTLGSKENYINTVATKRETSFHMLDCWRGLPNNRLQDPAGIPDCRVRMPLMTVSTAVITVLHSAEVVHVTHQS